MTAVRSFFFLGGSCFFFSAIFQFARNHSSLCRSFADFIRADATRRARRSLQPAVVYGLLDVLGGAPALSAATWLICHLRFPHSD